MAPSSPDLPIERASIPLACGEHGDHRGDIIGCCHECGLFLCEGHANFLPQRRFLGLRILHRFGIVEEREASPLVCGNHAPAFAARAGMPAASPKRSRIAREGRKARLSFPLASLIKRDNRPRRQPPPPASRRG